MASARSGADAGHAARLSGHQTLPPPVPRRSASASTREHAARRDVAHRQPAQGPRPRRRAEGARRAARADQPVRCAHATLPAARLSAATGYTC